MKKTWIYALVDPKSKMIRYVGKANNPEKRLGVHIRRAGHKQPRDRTHKDNWLLLLKRKELKPDIKRLEEVPDEIWQQKERKWISDLRQQGVLLLNILPGGEGGPTYGRLGKPWTEAHRKNYLAARIGMPTNQPNPNPLRTAAIRKAQVKRIAAGNYLKKHSKETKEKMRQAALKRSPQIGPRLNYKGATQYMWREKKQSLYSWAVELGIPKATLVTRLHRGWSLDRTLSTPSPARKN